ncbi:MAG: HD domain-containing protein [Chitinispirillia bacterium]|jgi:GTP pyrophosphokinase
MIDTLFFDNLDVKSRKLFEKALAHLNSIPTEKEKHSHLPQYITNVIRILYNEMFLGIDSIIAGMLYRYIQYKYISSDEIEKQYGSTVAQIASGAARIGKISKAKMEYHADYFIQLVLTLVNDPRSILIMLSEQLDKMRNYRKLPDKIKENLLNEIFYLYAPIAHRLGLYAIKTELEELWLKYARYKSYRKIADELAANRNERKEFITGFITPLEKTIQSAGISCDIKGRPKSIYSIWNKMNTQNISLDDIYDKFAIRIIINEYNPENEKELCWKVYSLVTEKYRPNPNRLRDWISLPKVSGYESLHTTVATKDNHWIEIQIRTKRMDEIAEKGDAAHWQYKESAKGEKNSEWLIQMRESLENPYYSVNRMNTTHEVPVFNNIYVFTPDEDLIRLKRGSTVLDFAFHIHSNVGLTCTGARVNGYHVPIKHILENGDIVEVITSHSQKPSEQWLNIVTSSRVRSKVKQALRRNERLHAKIGKEMLRQKLNTIDIEFSSENIDKIAAYFEQKNVMDLFENIGQHNIDLHKVKRVFTEHDASNKTILPVFPEKNDLPIDHQPRKHSDCIIIDEKLNGMEYSMAPCCHPIMGDDIFCYVTISRGMRVHKQNCPNAFDLYTQFPHRIFQAKWAVTEEAHFFISRLNIVGTDGKNTLRTTVNTFKDISGAKIISYTINPTKTNFTAVLFVDVVDKNKLDEIIKKIMKIKGVISVWRAG